MLKIIFALLFCILVAEVTTKDAYEYVPLVDRYIKIHRIPVSWEEARFRCHLEGGILASPENKDMFATMLKIMNDKSINKVYTGIHATYSKGDYTTVTGTPLSELDVQWRSGEPDNYDNEEDCLNMDSDGSLADVKCTNDYPFMCHKSPEKMTAHSCFQNDFNEHSDYVFNNETGSCYKFHREGSSWPVAFKTCLAEDAYLVIINSERESDILKELFAQNPPHTIPGGFHKDAASIGITKWTFNQEWYTIHGQSINEAGFTAFNAGEPNNVGGNENCGSIWRTGLLNDHNCGRSLTFICEKPITPNIDLRFGQRSPDKL